MIAAVATVKEFRQTLIGWREADESVALVPTMGALHAGHLSLIAAAKKMSKRVVASIFVNPTQFAAHEDLSAYPRQLEKDKQMLAEAGCDLLFAPSPEEIYPAGFATAIDPGPLATVLEGQFRPGHFRGVATVVAKLLLQALPDAAIFGEKDYQQLLVIRQTVRDLNIPVHIVGVPTLRDADGLALSSRNAYLSAEERQRAAVLPRILQDCAVAIRNGDEIEAVLAKGRAALEQAGFAVDYLELADPVTLSPLHEAGEAARLLVAAKIGKTRLIDNMAV